MQQQKHKCAHTENNKDENQRRNTNDSRIMNNHNETQQNKDNKAKEAQP